MQAMVLAAGLGTRLWPLTHRLAKPAVPFLGVPLVRRLVDQLTSQGFTRVVVNVHHLPHTVSQALIGVPRLVLSHESEILGTAGGIARALEDGKLEPTAPLLVVNGKIETDADFRRLMRTHADHPDDVTMLLAENLRREAFREVFVDQGRVTGFGEGRQPETERPLCFTGIHILGPPALAQLRPVFSDTVREIYPDFLARGRLRHLLHRGRWWEFSTPERYLGLHWRAWASFASAQTPRAPAHRSVVWGPGELAAGVELDACIVMDPARIPPGRYRHEVLAPSEAAQGPEGALPPGARVEGSLLRVPLDPTAIQRSA